MKKIVFLTLMLFGFSYILIAPAHSAPKSSNGNEGDFMDVAYSSGMMEIQLGQMAQEQAKMQEVKDFGARMEGDHARANNELKGIAKDKKITLPTNLLPEHRAIVDKLKSLSGTDFDKAYMQEMVNEHTKDIADFKSAARSITDRKVTGWIDRVLPVMAEHLQLAREVASKVGQ